MARTSLMIPDELIQRAKIQAASENKQLSEFVTEAIRDKVTIVYENHNGKTYISGPSISMPISQK